MNLRSLRSVEISLFFHNLLLCLLKHVDLQTAKKIVLLCPYAGNNEIYQTFILWGVP
jgi:hypothetical protein